MEADPSSKTNAFHRAKRRIRLRPYLLAILAILLTSYDLWGAANLTSAEPDDAKGYSQIAKNVLDAGVYSIESVPPFTPTLIRLPGYPLLIAGTYALFGEGNNGAIRYVQGFIHLLSALAAGLLAWNWCGRKRRRKRTATVAAFVLAAVCPFTLIYTGVLLTETATMFLMAILALACTLAIKGSGKRSVVLWIAAGIVAGLGVEIRPDFGLLAAGIGVLLVISTLREGFRNVLTKGMVYSLAFAVVLTPWTIRNYQVFGIFQPISPPHGEMPGEFVPHGYFLWLRTWLTEFRYVDSFEWGLEKQRIDPQLIPSNAFANENERLQVFALIDRYNNSDPEHPLKLNETREGDNDEDSDSHDDDTETQSDNSRDAEAQDNELDLRIDPDVDAAFAVIANERIQNDPLRFYFVLPAERIVNMWFDTHSDYYSFAGELLPLKDLDSETYQNLWLPLFIVIVWGYSLLAVAGLFILIVTNWRSSWVFVLMLFLLVVPRAIFIGGLENPEPRYFVEYFIFAAVLAGIFLSRFTFRCGRGRANISFDYESDRTKNR